MADLLIKGMEMPKNCMDCSCSTWKFDDPVPFICLIAKVNCELKCRPSNCPLVEVKPHGRLIDADALKSKIIEQRNLDNPRREKIYNKVLDFIFDATTVLRASE